MNRISSSILILTMLGLASCTQEELGPQPVDRGQRISLRVIPKLPEEVVSRGTLNEDKLYNMNVLVFNPDDALFTRQYADNATSASNIAVPTDNIQVDLVTTGYNVAGYVVYMAANMGLSNDFHATTPSTNKPEYFQKYFASAALESDLMNRTCPMNPDLTFKTAISTAVDAIPMVGKKILTGNETSIEIDLERPVAKVNYTITVDKTNTNLKDFYIIGVRFGGVPEATYLWGKGTDLPLADGEYIVSDWFNALNAQKVTGTVYLPENRKGKGGDKNSTTVKGAPKNATYMEILVEYEASAQSGELGKRAYYKVYLGKDNTENYDVIRNANYTLNVNINGINEITQDVHITIPDTSNPANWYKTNGLVLHYDGIANDGRDKLRVNNNSPLKSAPTADPAIFTWSNPKFNYPSTGDKLPDTSYNTNTAGKKNRWKNIAPTTEGQLCLPLYQFGWNSTSGWGGDCLILKRGNYATIQYDDERLRPQRFTIEVVFRSEPGMNGLSGGCDIFGFLLHPDDGNIKRYVSAGIECYGTGFGFIANGKWNGQNYSAGDIEGVKRRVVLQYDGVYAYGWYGKQQVYREMKWRPGPMVWNSSPLPAPGGPTPTEASPDPTGMPSLLTFGRYYPNTGAADFSGRIYAFRFYDRVLSKEELDFNFDIDQKRFGVPNP